MRKEARDITMIRHWTKICKKYRFSKKKLSKSGIEQWKYAEAMLKKAETTPL